MTSYDIFQTSYDIFRVKSSITSSTSICMRLLIGHALVHSLVDCCDSERDHRFFRPRSATFLQSSTTFFPTFRRLLGVATLAPVGADLVDIASSLVALLLFAESYYWQSSLYRTAHLVTGDSLSCSQETYPCLITRLLSLLLPISGNASVSHFFVGFLMSPSCYTYVFAGSCFSKISQISWLTHLGQIFRGKLYPRRFI